MSDWVQNPYHGRRERAYLVKLRVDFGDIVGVCSANSNAVSSGGGVGQSGDNNKNNKEREEYTTINQILVSRDSN